MRKTNLVTKVVALTLAVMSFTSVASMNTGFASEIKKGTSLAVVSKAEPSSLVKDTFTGLLEKSITAGVQAGVKKAIMPLVEVMGKELFGFDMNSGITEIRKQLDSMDSKLDDIKREVSEGFDKVLSEVDKNNKMKNAIDALAKAEFIAREIMNSDKTLQIVGDSNISNLTPAQQKKIVEINADIVNNQQISELYANLKLAKEYMMTGFIDTNYDNVFNIYYKYMKKQSMFCGEAANKAKPFWEMMNESYSKSCIALLYGLEFQKSLHMLSESQPTSEISQEAIDAASVAKTFGSLNVIDNKIANVISDGSELISKYSNFIDQVEAESTTFINKDKVYVELKSDVKGVNIANGKTYDEYVKHNNFKNEGIDKKVYNRVVEQVPAYYYHYNDFAIDLSSVPYENFIQKTGDCVRYNMVTDCSNKGTVKFADVCNDIFANAMLNLKFEKFNTVNKLEDANMDAIVKHICENYEDDSIETYLESVGFDLENINAQGQVFLPTDKLVLNKNAEYLSSSKDVYAVSAYNKKHNSLREMIDTSNPSGSLMFLEKEHDTIEVNIKSVSMNGRISKALYTITGKQIVNYDSNNKPVYRLYEKVCEVNGTKDMYFRLPDNVDFNTLEIKLGYEGTCASSNHGSVCSYSLKNAKTPCSEITLNMKGYTKWWGGYGVNASISCDGNVVANGHD